MAFGSDERADLSGVPQDLLAGRTASNRPSQPDQRSQFRSMLGIAVWLCLAMVIGLAVAFVLFRLPSLFGPVSPAAQATQSAEPDLQDKPAIQISQAPQGYDEAMRDATTASDIARRQHEQAMKAVEAARVLAKDPDSLEAQEALKQAMQRVQAMSEEANR